MPLCTQDPRADLRLYPAWGEGGQPIATQSGYWHEINQSRPDAAMMCLLINRLNVTNLTYVCVVVRIPLSPLDCSPSLKILLPSREM